MPAAVAAIPAIGWITAGSAAATVAGQAMSARAQGRAAREAQAAQTKAADEALAFQRQQYADERADYERSEAERKAAWEAEEARLAPKRAMANEARRRYAELTGIQVPELQTPTSMPRGWQTSTSPRNDWPQNTNRPPVYGDGRPVIYRDGRPPYSNPREVSGAMSQPPTMASSYTALPAAPVIRQESDAAARAREMSLSPQQNLAAAALQYRRPQRSY